MRTLLVLTVLLGSASTAWAQGYDVAPTAGMIEDRPDAAVPLDLDGDRDSTSIRLPFSFRYYGDAYDHLVVSAHGWVLPGAADPTVPTGQDPDTGDFPYRRADAADGIIAPLRTSTAASRVFTWVSGNAPDRRFVIAWETRRARVQVHLHEGPGRIVFAYHASAVTGGDAEPDRSAYVCGLDEPAGPRFVVPLPAGKGAGATPSSDFTFEPRTVLFNPPGLNKQGVTVRWLPVRKESTVPDGCTKRCTYLAKGRGYFFVPDRARYSWHPKHGRRKHPPDLLRRLVEEDRNTFGGTVGDADRWIRQVLDGKMIFLPADGADPVRIWFRIIEYFTINDRGLAGADFHTWNLRWMLSNAFPGRDRREKIDRYYAWRAMATGRLTVGKLFRAKQTDDGGKQYDSGRTNEYLLWSGHLKHGTRGALAKYAMPGGDGWIRFYLREQDMHLDQHHRRGDLRFVADPNYVDGEYEYVVESPDNPHGWITGRAVPPLPVRDEPFDVDPGRATGPVTPR